MLWLRSGMRPDEADVALLVSDRSGSAQIAEEMIDTLNFPERLDHLGCCTPHPVIMR